jgi:hypothetical protein
VSCAAPVGRDETRSKTESVMLSVYDVGDLPIYASNWGSLRLHDDQIGLKVGLRSIGTRVAGHSVWPTSSPLLQSGGTVSRVPMIL